MPYNKLIDYIYTEFKADAKDTRKDIDDIKNISMKQGKKYAQNYWTSLKALESLSGMVRLYNSWGGNIDHYIALVPDDIAAELIELYEAYKIDAKYGHNVDDVKYFREVHLVSLVYFSFAYARYNELDEYKTLWLKMNPACSPDEVFTTKADAINTFNEQCKVYSTSTDFIRESIKLMKPDFVRIKMTKDYKERVAFVEKSPLGTDSTKMDKVLKDIDETNRSKFR